jgi:phosphoribosylanthranilate isomerase
MTMACFHVKICGITSVGDAQTVAEAGADAVGLNFYPRSPRFVGLDRAREIARSLPREVAKVGVFVNSTPDEVRRALETVGLDLVQLHGDETPDDLRHMSDLPLIRAQRLGEGGLKPVHDYLDACRKRQVALEGILIDSFRSGEYGGTGLTADWSLLQPLQGAVSSTPLILAGGLTPANVAAAIRAVRPAGVDTASGVEAAPGRKDPDLVRSFIAAARAAFAEIRLGGSANRRK